MNKASTSGFNENRSPATSASGRSGARVIIFYATGGRGHVTAAKAITEAFAKFHPEVTVTSRDIVEFASPWYRLIFVDGYNFISAHAPGVWGRLYHFFNKPRNQTGAKYISQWAIEKRLLKFIRSEKPDFIISTHPLPMQLVSHSKHRDVIDILSSMVVTDFGCHTFWVDSEVNYYFVATEEVAMCLAGYGVAREKSVVTGIPLELKFTKSIDRLALCQKFGIDPKRPTLLMVGGQFSFDEMNAIMHEVEQAHPDVQFLAVAGRDEQLKKALDGSDLHSRGNVKTFGFVDNMEEMMSVARLIFTKAGGLTVSECLAKGLPMIINKVIPGQEDDNVQFLTRHGAAIQVKEGESVAQAVIALLSDSSRLEKMRAAAEALGHPKSSVEVANFVAERVGLLSS